MAAFAYTDPPALAALRATVPSINPSGGARALGEAVVLALEGLAEKISDLVTANENSHSTLNARLGSVESVMSSFPTTKTLLEKVVVTVKRNS